MSGFLNKVTLIGNLGADPETRTTQNGKTIANFSLATSTSWKDPHTGERVERTEWHRVVIFSEGLAKLAETYLAKGAKVYVEGSLSTRKWQDRDGYDRWTTEVQLTPYNGVLTFLSSKSDAERTASGQSRRQPAVANGHRGDEDLDDQVPF